MAKQNSTAKQNKKQPSDCHCNETKSKTTTKSKATKNAKDTMENK